MVGDRTDSVGIVVLRIADDLLGEDKELRLRSPVELDPYRRLLDGIDS